MAGTNEVFADFTALEELAARLSTMVRSFSGIEQLPDVSPLAIGDRGVAGAYQAFCAKWRENRQLMVDELESAEGVVREAVMTYRSADAAVAGAAES